jgi:hypothetical protein
MYHVLTCSDTYVTLSVLHGTHLLILVSPNAYT